MGQVVFEDGSPVAAGSIEFRDIEDGELFASRIKGGWFQPENKKGKLGLPPGDYEIVVVQVVLTEDLAKAAHSHGNTVPRRYADYHTSGLEATIGEGQTDGLKVVLQSE